MSRRASFVFVVEYVPDIEAAQRFFVDVLGLEVERGASTFVQFRDQNGASFAITTDESIDGSGKQEIYWAVDDAEASFKELSASAEVSVPLKQMPFGKVFAIKDPAGQSQYLIEFAQVRPSSPVD